MRVQIDGRYVYETDLPDVEIGDEMVLPSTMSPEAWTGIVTSLEPEYDGPYKRVIGLSRRRAQVDARQEALGQVRISGWRIGQMISKPCAQCGEERHYIVEAVNNVGRPTSVRSQPCSCGAPINGYGLGSAASFRHFMVDPKL